MTIRKYLNAVSIIFLILGFNNVSYGYTGISVESGGGYSSNLYADSFSLGDSYLYGGLSLTNIQFDNTRLKTYYDLTYYRYSDRNSINQFNHLAGISVFRKLVSDKLKWSVDLAGTYRDYTEANSDYDNYNIFLSGDISYCIITGLRGGLAYRLKRSEYSGFDNLNHTEHKVKSTIIKTLPTRTTVRAKAEFYRRYFKIDDSKVDWLDLEFKLSQSIDIRTGVSAATAIRFTGNGTRPLSSYYILSGITPYWDPWDGYQLHGFLKRIFPWGVINITNIKYWNRKFSYSEAQQEELPWLTGISTRNDDGWSVDTQLDKQINLTARYFRALKVELSAGYYSNNSDDDYYDYDFFQCALSLIFYLK